ncbi:MAG: amidohydrolase, partial [Ferruginibacter sp.]
VAYSQHAPAQWLYGRGWDQNDWAVKEFPDKKILDSLFPDRPVYLKRIDGHAALANQAALNLAGFNADTLILGGAIEKKDSLLTGILIDNAMGLVEYVIPAINDTLAREYFTATQKECFLEGLTGVQDCGISEHTLQLLEESQKDGSLKMKIFALLSDNESYYDKWVIRGPYTNGLIHVGGFKMYADGALGSRGACLLQDYTDKPGWKGFLLRDSAYLAAIAVKLVQSGLQMCTHAIGDSSNRLMLKIYADVLKGKNDRRWRIEHAQMVNDSDFHYFADYSIIPSVQPTHATSDMYWAGDRLGPVRIKNAYAYKTLMNTNGWIPLGTDFPVEYLSPIKTFYAAVIRKDANDFPENGFQAEEALTREQALRGMTIWAARAAFEEKEKGSLEKGKAADFIMTDQDIMQCEPDKILKTKVLKTFVNGQSVGL